MERKEVGYMASHRKKPAARNARDAGSGKYVPLREATRRPKEVVTEPRPARKKKSK